MRQAGRSLPGYRKIRKQYGLFEVVRQPELCAEVTLEPVRLHGVDAAVMFADIMLPVLGMGVDVDLVENVGPVIERPIETLADVERLGVPDPAESVPFVLDAVRLVREGLTPEQALIGFCGGPFTVAGYLIEGKPTRDFVKTKRCLYAAPEVWHALAEKLTDTFVPYLRAKVAAGADVVQLFDSWVGALSRQDYQEFVAPYSARILAEVNAPSIHFGTGTAHLLEAMTGVGGDVIGLDWRSPLNEAWQRIGYDRGVQGNLEPALLLGPVGARRAGGRVDHQCGGRPAGSHLQPRPRRVAGHRSRRPQAARRVRPRTDREGGRVKAAVVLMAYGSPEGVDDIRPYLEDIREGRPVSDAAVEELTERYRRIGGRSPLDEITERQRAALGSRARRARVRGDEALAAADRGCGRAGAGRRRGDDRRPRAGTPLFEAVHRRVPGALGGGARGPGRAALRRALGNARALSRRARRAGARIRRARRLHGAQPAGADSRRGRPLPGRAPRDCRG